MNSFSTVHLKQNETQAVKEFKRLVSAAYPEPEIILYGSKARGESGMESDIDLLVILAGKVTSAIEHELSIIKFDIELKYDVVIGMIVENREYWRSDRIAVTPLHVNIDREGIWI